MPQIMTMARMILAIVLLSAFGLSCRTQGSHGTTGPDLAPFQPIHLPTGTHPDMPIAVDVNKDGIIDLLVVNGGSRNVSVYLGDNKGGFAQASGSPPLL